MKRILLRAAAFVMTLSLLWTPVRAEKAPDQAPEEETVTEMDFVLKGEDCHVSFMNVGVSENSQVRVRVKCGGPSWPKGWDEYVWAAGYDADGEELETSGRSMGDDPVRDIFFMRWNELPETVYLYKNTDKKTRFLVWRNPGRPETLTSVYVPGANEQTEADVIHYGKPYHVVLRSIGFGESGDLCVAMSCPEAWHAKKNKDGNRVWVSVGVGGEEIKASHRGSDDGADEQIFHFDSVSEMPDAVYIRSTDDKEKDRRVLIWQKGGEYVPGEVRTAQYNGFDTARNVADRFGISLTDGMPLYTPAWPRPLNAYMVTHEDCQVGINNSGMFTVSEKGLVPEITKYLEEWIGLIQEDSGDLIRFVENPDFADILVCAELSYSYYGTYTGGTKGYSCTVTLTAVQLTNPANRCFVVRTRKPENTVSVKAGSARFWKNPPDFGGSQEIRKIVHTAETWYGLDGKDKSGVKQVQKALIARGYMKGKPNGSLNGATQKAIKKFQADCGLPQTGNPDEETLLRLYYAQ